MAGEAPKTDSGTERTTTPEGRFLSQETYTELPTDLKLHIVGRVPERVGDESEILLVWRTKEGDSFTKFRRMGAAFLCSKENSQGHVSIVMAMNDSNIEDPAFPDNTFLTVQNGVITTFELPEELT